MGDAAKKRQVDSGEAELRLQRHKQLVVQTKQFNNNVRIAMVFIVGFLLGTVSIALLFRRDFSSVNSLRADVLDAKVTKQTIIKIEEADGTEVIRKKVQDVKGLVKPKKLPVQKKTNATAAAAPRPGMRGSNSTSVTKPKAVSAPDKALPSSPRGQGQPAGQEASGLGISKDKIPLDSKKSIKPVLGADMQSQKNREVKPQQQPGSIGSAVAAKQQQPGTVGGVAANVGAFPSSARPKNDEDFLKMIQNRPADSFSSKPAALQGNASAQKTAPAAKVTAAVKAKADKDNG